MLIEGLEFNVFEYSKNQLIDYEEKMFRELGLKVERDLLLRIQEGYSDHPFHNSYHSFDVTQMVYILLRRGGIMKYLDQEDILSLMVSALGHDLLHPGFKGKDLEKQSYQETIRILSEQQIEVKDNIMATDLSRHYQVLERFENNKKNKKIIMQMTMKLADISNSLRPYNIALEWLERVRKEHNNKEESQLAFIEKLLKPLLISFSEILEDKDYWFQYLNENITLWSQ
jgi:high affinity cGMP-specific 3',5'-cyclic phosphodiesterase 9